MITSISLDDAQRGLSFAVKPATGIALQALDVTGSIREDAEDDPNSDGSLDFTRYLGPGAVIMELKLTSGTRAALDALARFCAPHARPYMTVTDSEWSAARRIMLRAESWAHPVQARQGLTRLVQYAWKAPLGVWEDTAPQTTEILADVPDTTGMVMTPTGIVVTGTEGYVMPASTAQAATLLAVQGSAHPRWTARLYGPCDGPVLTRDDTGQSITFKSDWHVPSGSYVEVNPVARTVKWLSDPDQDRSAYLDYPDTDWFDLEPGVTLPLRYHAAANATAATRALLTYTPLWIP